MLILVETPASVRLKLIFLLLKTVSLIMFIGSSPFVSRGNDGCATTGKDLYISRAGDDSWPCNSSKPCKNIWRAVSLASFGDHITLDGTNTDKDPYTCQSGYSQHPGININKSLSFMGSGPILPHIRCLEGTSLTFSGSHNASRMEVTLSRLLLKETFLCFQDFSAKIDGCKLEISRKGLQFYISDKVDLAIQVTNSSFVRNNKCISVVVVKNTKNSSQAIEITVVLKNSSFYHNTMSDNGWGMSFIESLNSNQPVSCNITLDNVTFSDNKFSSRGLVFLKLESGYQNIYLQDVTFLDNKPLSGQDFLAGYIHSECIVRSTVVNIIIDGSKFASRHARLMNIRVSRIYLEFHNSHFRGHRVDGNGGALSLTGTDVCMLNIFNSSFVNTNASQGGAINAECEIVRFCSQDNTFTGNTAMHKDGGAVFIDTFGCMSGDSGESFQISIKNSRFTSNYAAVSGGALSFSLPEMRNERWRSRPCQITIENSTFSTNRAAKMGGAIFVELINPESVVILENVTMESNGARFGGGLAVPVSIFTLKVHRSKFLRNIAHMEGGVLYVGMVNTIEVVDSYFEGGLPSEEMPRFGRGFGGALFLPGTTLISRSITIINTTFTNFLTGKQGGVIYLAHLDEENTRFVVKRCRFVDNASFQNLGGAIFLSLAPDTQKDPGCLPESQTDDAAQRYPSWHYKSHVIFEDTNFRRNAADLGGAVYLGNGKAIFRNCFFVDNFARTQGGHIYTVAGSASIMVRDSILRQTTSQLQLLTITFSKTSFIHAESSGTFKVFNTTMDARPYGNTGPLMLVTNGRLIGIGNWTEFYCPVGSELDILDFSNLLTTQVCNTTCKLRATTLIFSCSACGGNSYSLQRGRAIGSQLVPGFKCLPCPFGAKCAQNIFAKVNFWGFQEQVNPPAVRFAMCPLGYCSTPKITDFPQYNGCQGNRSGILCGHCDKNYTETLYSTHCRPSHQCHDFWFWPMAVIYVSIMALYFTFRPPIVPWIKRQILWFKDLQEDQENSFDKGYLKIIFHFYQTANLFLITNSSQLVIKTNLIDPLVGLFNFQQTLSPSGLICSFPGLTVVSKQLFSAFHVFSTLLMICVFYALRSVLQKFRGQEVPSIGPYVGGILQTLLLGYTTLASVSFNLLRCVSIGSEKRLFYDGNVVCFQWWQYILIAFVCAFVIPFVSVLLWGSYKLYNGNLSAGKFLLACSFPLPSILYWSFASLFVKTSNQVVEGPSPRQFYVERVLYDSFKRPEGGRKLSLSWEGVTVGRRLILVVLRSFVSNPLPRVLIMSAFSVLFLLHHVLTQPFRDDIANTVETISLVFIVFVGLLNVFFASFLSLAVPFKDHFSSWWNVFQGAEVVILCFIPAIFGLLMITAVISQLCRLCVAVCRVMCNVCSICFRFCCSNQAEETRPLLAPAN